MSLPSRIAGAFALALMLVLGACSTGPSGGAPGGSSSPAASDAAASSFPVTIEHAFGSTTIDREPRRIATVGWTDHETLASLGIIPVGATRVSWGGNSNGSTDWFDAAVKDSGAAAPVRYSDTAGVPDKEIAALAPDLILATNSGITSDDYKKLSRIAPVVAYPKAAWGTTWQESLRLIGQAVGRQQKAAEVEQQTADVIAAGVKKYPELAGRSAAWLWFSATDYSKIGIYTSLDARPNMLRSFGFEESPYVKEQSRAKPDQFSIEVSAEKAKEVAADIAVFYTTDGVELEKVLSSPLLRQIPAVESGAYVAASDANLALPLSSPTPLSIPIAVEKFLPLLAEAATRAR